MPFEESQQQFAFEVAGFLRELERKSGDLARRNGTMRRSVSNVLAERLRAARRLLGDDHWLMEVVDELETELMAEQADLDLVNEHAAYIANALETRYRLRGGGHGIPASGNRRAITLPIENTPADRRPYET
ncbi:hypothetical protein [Micromonospora chalcea]|uniref:hypothetical protein n=1 Tax=Micromonospora chalcea TaxID=1874 RepID=UPI0037C64714